MDTPRISTTTITLAESEHASLIPIFFSTLSPIPPGRNFPCDDDDGQQCKVRYPPPLHPFQPTIAQLDAGRKKNAFFHFEIWQIFPIKRR